MKPRRPARLHLQAISRSDLVRRINRLPHWAQQYIHDLATRADPAGDIETIADLRFQVKALSKLVEELRRELRKSVVSV